MYRILLKALRTLPYNFNSLPKGCKFLYSEGKSKEELFKYFNNNLAINYFCPESGNSMYLCTVKIHGKGQHNDIKKTMFLQ